MANVNFYIWLPLLRLMPPTSYHRKALDYIPVAESLGISLTTFTQCTPNATDFAEITKIRATAPFKVIQGHRFWYQSKAHNMRLPISD